MSKRKQGGTSDRDEAYRLAKYLAGWHTPRWWWRGLSRGKFFRAVSFVSCMIAAAGDNRLPAKNLKRPRWFPKRYVYGSKPVRF